MKFLLKISLLMLIVLIMSSFAYAASITVPEDIRIGLFYSSSAKSQVTLSSPGGIRIGTIKDGVISYKYEVKANVSIKVSKGSTWGAVKVDGYGEVGNENEYPYFKSLNDDKWMQIIVVDGKKYRGNIEIRRFSDSDMTIINHLSMQEYLYGVVPREIGGTSPEEALKAQAIAARTYAAKNMNKHSKLGFNLNTTTSDQAYGGYEWENQKSNKAVDDTKGQVIISNGSLITPNYFATSGGYTEDSENVWGGKVDYLKAVPDTYEPEGKNTTWEVTMTQDQVKSTLKKNGIDVGDILDIVPTAFTDAGRVLKLNIIGTKGTKEVSKSSVRSVLGLKSQWYSVNSTMPQVKNGTPNDVDAINDDDIIVNVTNSVVSEEEKSSGDDAWWLKTIEDFATMIKEVDYNQDASLYSKEDSGDIITIEPKSGEEYIVIEEDKKEDKTVEPVKEELKEEPIKEEKETAKEEKVAYKESTITKEEVEPLFKKVMNLFNIVNLNQTNSKSTKYMNGASKSEFTFRGRGWGHAVGMSQDGAIGMAKNGFTAEQILKWYYSGVDIVS